MTKTQTSVSLEMDCFMTIRDLANKSFNRNFSAALNWVIYSAMKKEKFLRFMARHHAAQLHLFKEQLETLKDEIPTQKIFPEIEI